MATKIALVFDDSLDRADGVQQQLWLMGRWLAKHDQPAVYICSSTAAKEVEGLPVISLSRSLGVRANQNRLALPYPISQRTAQRVLAEQDIKLLHIMLPFSPWLGGRLVSAAQAAGVPVVGTFHTYPSNLAQRWGSRAYGALFGRRLRGFKRVFSVSSATADSVKRLYGVDSVVMPNFVDMSAFSTPPQVGKKARTAKPQQLVYVGRLVERKGPQHLLTALGRLKGRGELGDLHTTIIGDGPLRNRLQSQANAQGLGSNVTFAGFVSEASKAQMLAGADLAVFPATGGEAFGIVLLEAMAAGALVLGGDNPGYRSVLNQPLQLVNPTNPEEFAARIRRLLSDWSLRQKLLKAQHELLPIYDVEHVMPKLLKAYQQALAPKGKLAHTDS